MPERDIPVSPRFALRQASGFVMLLVEPLSRQERYRPNFPAMTIPDNPAERAIIARELRAVAEKLEAIDAPVIEPDVDAQTWKPMGKRDGRTQAAHLPVTCIVCGKRLGHNDAADAGWEYREGRLNTAYNCPRCKEIRL